MVQEKIQVSNKPDLSEEDAKKMDEVIKRFSSKAGSLLGDEFLLSIHFKQYHSQGMRKKHSVHARLSGSGFNGKAEAADWNSIYALQDSLAALFRELKEFAERKK